MRHMASFSALMENQVLINQNLGDLWSERRKFSGAVIRRAVELAGLESPSSEDIDLLINDYREWLQQLQRMMRQWQVASINLTFKILYVQIAQACTSKQIKKYYDVFQN